MTTPTMTDVLAVVSREYHIPVDVILNRDMRTLAVTRARHVAQYLACTVTFMSKDQIASHFKQNDHSAVFYALNKVTKLVLTDEATCATVGRLKRSLTSE